MRDQVVWHCDDENTQCGMVTISPLPMRPKGGRQCTGTQVCTDESVLPQVEGVLPGKGLGRQDGLGIFWGFDLGNPDSNYSQIVTFKMLPVIHVGFSAPAN